MRNQILMRQYGCKFLQRIIIALIVSAKISVADHSLDLRGLPNEETFGDTGLDLESDHVVIDPSSQRDAEDEYPTQEADRNIRKRTMSSEPKYNWGLNIPVVFDSSYSDPFNRNLVRRVMRHINSRTCLNMVDETSRWDRRNPHWFTQNGYIWDTAMIIKSTSGCSTSGSVKNGSNVEVKPCADSDIISHEVLHGLGIYHGQESNTAPSYISVFKSNVKPGLWFTYDSSSPYVTTKYYEPTSTTHYSSGTWGLTGDDTFVCIRPDFCRKDDTVSDENVNFKELNEKYNCSGVYCSHIKVDCSPGYLAYANRECRCVCPREFNASTNCKTLVDSADTSLEWPIPLTVIAGGETKDCPVGFDPAGWFSFCVTLPSTADVNLFPFPQNGETVQVPVCSKTEPSSNIDWNAIPMGGRYCFIKAKGIPCGGIFIESTWEIQSSCPAQSNGSVGSVTIDGGNITITLCCNDDDSTHYPMTFPNSKPFRLFMTYSCPHVRGMRTYPQKVRIAPKKVIFSGKSVKPFNYFWDKQHNVYLCYYQPFVYGCNQNVKLTVTNKRVTITTPGYPGARPPNKRCIYCFQAPTSTQIRVTFNHYDLAAYDMFRIKRFHKWLEPYRMNNDNPEYQFVTDSNYLCMEFVSGFQSVENKGANFTVEVLFASDSCYNASQKGMDYVGTTNISETYEACLPWADTISCWDSPINGQDALTGYYESNYCRNPGGKLLQPWCYVYRNETSCMKRYCDVCNTKVPVDALKTSFCTAQIVKSPKFCQESVQRFGCFKSCGMAQAPARPSDCGKVPVPKNGLLLGKAQKSYKAGDRVLIQCKKPKLNDTSSTELLCGSKGWSAPLSACSVSVPSKIKEKYKACPEILAKYPNFCTDPRTSYHAAIYCGVSCGQKKGSRKCREPKATLYTRTSDKAVVEAGEVMTFACKGGYFLTGGDTSRACGTKGVLLGAEPVCDNNPPFLDFGLSLVRARQDSTNTNMAFVMDLPEYRIPIAGKVTIWYYYCKAEGLIYFLVFKKDKSDYRLIGYNEVTCQPDRTIGYDVTPTEQISVVEGDLVGAWTPESKTLSATNCKSALVKLMIIPSTKISSVARLKTKTNYADQICLIPAIGYRVARQCPAGQIVQQFAAKMRKQNWMRQYGCKILQRIIIALIVSAKISVAVEQHSLDLRGLPNEETFGDTRLDLESDHVVLDLSRQRDAENEYPTQEAGRNIRKRVVSSEPKYNWGLNIPVVFDSSYSDPFNQNLARRVMRHINSRTCLNMVDETSRWDRRNPHWFTQNGYIWDSAMIIKSASGCAISGSVTNGSNVEVKPCSDSDIITHEVLHGLGIYHGQESNTAPSYISVFKSNVNPGLWFTYDSSSPYVTTKYYEPTSTTHYSSGTWGLTGDDTFVCIRPEFCRKDDTVSDESVNFEEVNEKYNCSSVYCSHIKVDCSPGYLAYANRECRCVCPDEFNASTNCKTLIDSADTSLEWPIPLTVIAGGETKDCPVGFDSAGWFSFCVTLRSTADANLFPFPQNGEVVQIPVCSKTEPSSNIDWNAIPMGGRYCFIKAKGIPCGGIFIESTWEIQSSCPAQSNGSVGSINIDKGNITITLCCNDDDSNNYPMAFPNSKPFRLFMIYTCPHVRGMRTYNQRMRIAPKKVTFSGKSVKPFNYFWDKQHNVFLCYYQPFVYGCNQNVNLTVTNRSVTITTPGYPGARPPNKRCIYCFQAPTSTQLRVTFIHYDLAAEDMFRIKRFHKWLEPYRMNNNNPDYQFVTDSNYLCMEFVSGFQSGGNKGANFTVELLFASDSCYNTSQNGLDYVGTTNISETYEACLPWADTISCWDSPANGQDFLTGYYEGNYCRNPGGKLLQPWCFVYRNETSCIKRYCDVCNTKVPVDALKTSFCTAQIVKSPKFCQESVQRFGCFKSCGMAQAPARPSDCGKVPVPKNGLLLGNAQKSYKAGDRVLIQCKKPKLNDTSNTELLCGSKGWSAPLSACSDPSKIEDKYKSCPETLAKYPNFCTDPRTSYHAAIYCGVSCGQKKGSRKCREPKATLYTRTSDKAVVEAGEVMTFACKGGYFLTGGDTSRACGTKGVLLGAEPVCDNNPPFLDFGLSLVRARQDSTNTNMAFVMDLPEYRIPITGKVTIWYYYCKAEGLIYFLVFKKDKSDYHVIGYNEVTCQPDRTIGYDVTPTEQISVVEGDLVGAWTPESKTLSSTNCKSALVKLMIVPWTKISSVARLKTKTNYADQICLIPAIGYRVARQG